MHVKNIDIGRSIKGRRGIDGISAYLIQYPLRVACLRRSSKDLATGVLLLLLLVLSPAVGEQLMYKVSAKHPV